MRKIAIVNMAVVLVAVLLTLLVTCRGGGAADE